MIKNLKIPIYHGTLKIMQFKSLDEIPKDYLGDYKDFETRGNDAIAYWYDDKNLYRYYWMAFKEKTSPECIAHESFHAMNYIFKDRQVDYNTSNDEHAAYLLGWIVKMCHKYLKGVL